MAQPKNHVYCPDCNEMYTAAEYGYHDCEVSVDPDQEDMLTVQSDSAYLAWLDEKAAEHMYQWMHEVAFKLDYSPYRRMDM
jgi:hypothetical protein